MALELSTILFCAGYAATPALEQSVLVVTALASVITGGHVLRVPAYNGAARDANRPAVPRQPSFILQWRTRRLNLGLTVPLDSYHLAVYSAQAATLHSSTPQICSNTKGH